MIKMEVLNKIKAEIESFNEKRKSLVTELQKEFPALLKPLFVKHPDVTSVSWHQYTPYFNDGDECLFGVRHDNDDIEINGLDYYDDSNYYKEERRLIFKDFAEVFQSIPVDFYKDLFGDHVQVTVHADGRIDVEEYEHN